MLERLARVSVAALAITTVGCSSDLAGNPGELGEGVFRYGCVENGDVRCNDTDAVDTLEISKDIGIEPELPRAFAVGGRFDLTYVGDTINDEGELIIIDVEPARPDLVTHAAGFVIEAPGTFAFLARNGPKRIVADFIHVDAYEVEAVDVWRQEQKVSSVTVDAATSAEVAVVAMAEGGIALAGALPIQWVSSDPTVVAVGSVGGSGMPMEGIEINDDEVRLYGVAEGSATVTVTQGEVSTEIAVTVNPEVTQ